MTNKWLEMCLAIPDQAVDLVSQALMDLGCTGITAAEKELDTFVVPPPETLANDPIMRAYFIYPDDVDHLCLKVQKSLSELSSIHPELTDTSLKYREIADHDWESDWQQHFPPFKVGDRLVIHPSWINWPSEENEVALTLDPGQAFGTGTHATTGLCLEAVAEHFASSCPPQNVLDVGTGSGILAMASAALGAQEVIGCDIDREACDVASENVAQNRLTEKVTITNRFVENIPGQYDLVLANILSAENIRLAKVLVERLAPRGRLVLSGILIEQEQQVINAFAAFFPTCPATSHRDEWSCIVYQNHE